MLGTLEEFKSWCEGCLPRQPGSGRHYSALGALESYQKYLKSLEPEKPDKTLTELVEEAAELAKESAAHTLKCYQRYRHLIKPVKMIEKHGTG